MSTERRPMVPLAPGDSVSTLTREEIKYRDRVARKSDSWVSPHHGDGGWHTTPGMQLFVTEWEPLRDRIMVKLFPEPIQYSQIVRPESAAPLHAGTRRGVVLKAGPGRWIDGYFYKLDVKPGDEIVIGRWSDWESADAGWGPNVVICQEADIRVVISRGNNGHANSNGKEETTGERFCIPEDAQLSDRRPQARASSAAGSRGSSQRKASTAGKAR